MLISTENRPTKNLMLGNVENTVTSDSKGREGGERYEKANSGEVKCRFRPFCSKPVYTYPGEMRANSQIHACHKWG